MVTEHKPAELVQFHHIDGDLESIGVMFDVRCPFAACRLCGAIYQTPDDRKSQRMYDEGYIDDALALYCWCTERRNRWRELHERRYHTQQEIEFFEKLGFAFTPEAAQKLAPYGITPMGNMHGEIIAALHEAPRAPLQETEGTA